MIGAYQLAHREQDHEYRGDRHSDGHNTMTALQEGAKDFGSGVGGSGERRKAKRLIRSINSDGSKSSRLLLGYRYGRHRSVERDLESK